MAVVLANNNIVDIPVGDTIIGVLLHRFISGDVRVRPTNVTATIDITNHDIEGGGLVGTVTIPQGGNLDLNFAFSGAANDATVFDANDEVIISGLIARDTDENGNQIGSRVRGTVVGNPTATAIVVNVAASEFRFLSSVPVYLASSDNQSIAIEDAESAVEDEFILLHNGPAGGFTQQCKPGSGDADTPVIPHHVNDVVQAVITDR